MIAYLALTWKVFGQRILTTRCAMLLLAAFSLLGFFRLARAVSNTSVAVWSTLLTAIYPVFFAQSSLAHVDLPAAGLAFWGLESYVRRRRWAMVMWFSLAALAKETAILIPLGLLLWKATRLARKWLNANQQGTQPYAKEISSLGMLLLPVFPLALWYAYHFAHTDFVFGNPEFFRYNVQENLHPLRIFLALLLRLWQTCGYFNLYVLTVACLIAMRYAPLRNPDNRLGEKLTGRRRPYLAGAELGKGTDHLPRKRIDLSIQFAFLAIAAVYLPTLSVLGGAVLARYMLPITPLFILVCVSTIWRRLRAWKPVLAIVAASFIAGIFVNPPYGFSFEDNLAFRDYIRLHQRAERFLETRYPQARVLTAWPGSDELSRPYLGYVRKAVQVVRIEDFTTEQLVAAADARSRFDVAMVFSTKYQPPHSLFDRWRLWQKWKTEYFGYHVDLPPEAAASVLGGELVYVQYLHGQWVGVIQLQTIEEAWAERPAYRLRKPLRSNPGHAGSAMTATSNFE